MVGTRQLGGAVREVCEVAQRVVEVEGIDGTVSGPGWVYESSGRHVRASGIRTACPGANPGRIYFSAPPQPGATVVLVCDGG